MKRILFLLLILSSLASYGQGVLIPTPGRPIDTNWFPRSVRIDSSLKVHGQLIVNGDTVTSAGSSVVAGNGLTAIGTATVTIALDTSKKVNTAITNGAAYKAIDSGIALKQNQLNGTGFVKASGTTISYDPSTFHAYNPVPPIYP